MRQELVVRVGRIDATWCTLGTDEARGIVPEDFEASADDNGITTITLTLRRDPAASWPDLAAFTPVEVMFDSQVIDGWVAKTPTSLTNRTIQLQCKGWQYLTDEVPVQRWYARTTLTDWVDTRSLAAEVLKENKAATAGTVAVDAGVTLGFPNGSVMQTGSLVAACLDFGPNSDSWPRTVVLAYETSGQASHAFYVRASDTPVVFPGTSGIDNLTSATLNAATSGTVNVDPTTPRRYLIVFLISLGGSTLTADVWVKFTRLLATGSTTWEASGASVLRAHHIIAAALTETPVDAVLAPSTSPIPGRIVQTSFDIPAFGDSSSRTPRETINAANAYHAFQWRVLPGQVFEYRPRPLVPLFEITRHSGADFENASANDAERIYNEVEVQGQAPDGTPLSVYRGITGTLADKRGRTRRAILPVRSPIDAATANQLGDVFLASRRATPLQGPLTVTGSSAVTRLIGGAGVDAYELLRHTGELIRFADLFDPDTNGKGRDGRIASVTYTHSSRTAKVQIDDQHDNLAVLLERVGALSS